MSMKWKFWKASDTQSAEDASAEPSAWGRAGTGAILLVGTYLVICAALAWWWDREPDIFAVRQHAASRAELNNQKLVTGYIATATLIELAKTMLDKRGGYLSNDVFPPGVWMDNLPNWEFGVLTQLRDTARVYRVDFSRSQSQSTEDPDLKEAEGRFFFDNASWVFPQTEDQYREGIALVEAYLDRLADPGNPGAQFYARADNLQQWLLGVETRLGSLSQRLSASVGKRQLDTALAGDPAAAQATVAPREQELKTPWFELDDVFFEARGQTWALLHLLKAMEHDFGDVLDKKNARVSLQQIIRELEPTQETVWSPLILNGDGLGLLANHSLVMASYVSRANAGITDLRTLLEQG
jgi:hypothetical protein